MHPVRERRPSPDGIIARCKVISTYGNQSETVFWQEAAPFMSCLNNMIYRPVDPGRIEKNTAKIFKIYFYCACPSANGRRRAVKGCDTSIMMLGSGFKAQSAKREN